MGLKLITLIMKCAVDVQRAYSLQKSFSVISMGRKRLSLLKPHIYLIFTLPSKFRNLCQMILSLFLF
jgi:hypothetical protein